MIILLEDEWDAEDIIEYCNQNSIGCKILPQREIFSIDPFEFFKHPFFCSTHIIQKNLKEIGLSELIPDTYDNIFNNLFKRTINKIFYKDLDKYQYPYFIKSTGNGKQIDGTIVTNECDLGDIWMVNQIEPTPDLELYISDIVKFDVEYRLLVGNHKVYGIGYQKGDNSIKIDNNFIEELLNVSNNKFYCIDVGYLNSMGQWAIVEVNPPFALDNFDIPIENYMLYCIDFWKINFITTKLI